MGIGVLAHLDGFAGHLAVDSEEFLLRVVAGDLEECNAVDYASRHLDRYLFVYVCLGMYSPSRIPSIAVYKERLHFSEHGQFRSAVPPSPLGVISYVLHNRIGEQRGPRIEMEAGSPWERVGHQYLVLLGSRPGLLQTILLRVPLIAQLLCPRIAHTCNTPLRAHSTCFMIDFHQGLLTSKRLCFCTMRAWGRLRTTRYSYYIGGMTNPQQVRVVI